MIKKNHQYLKIIMVGDSGVGKSSILTKYFDNKFEQNYKTTIGVDFKYKNLQIDDKIVKIELWDPSGQQRFKSITNSFFRGASSVLFIFDLTDRKSFLNIFECWIKQVQKHAEKDIIKLVIGNKCDLVDQRSVQKEEIAKYCQKNNLLFVESSAKKGTKINDIFESLAITFLRSKQKQKEKNYSGINSKIKINKSQEKQSCCG